MRYHLPCVVKSPRAQTQNLLVYPKNILSGKNAGFYMAQGVAEASGWGIVLVNGVSLDVGRIRRSELVEDVLYLFDRVLHGERGGKKQGDLKLRVNRLYAKQ